MSKNQILNQSDYKNLQKEIASLLNQAKQQVQEATTNILADCYWQIGKKISEEDLSENANYQNLLLQNLEEDLNINKTTLTRALQFYQLYPKGVKENISWSHYRHLITVTDQSTRDDLAKQVQKQNLSVRQLESNIKNLNQSKTSSNSNKKIKRPTDPSYLYKAKIVDVVDGDTLILHIDLGFTVIKEQRVRLAQINAPELKTAAGRKSHHYLRDLCASIQEVAVKTNKIDIYGRYLADIFYLRSEAKKGTTQGHIFTKGIYLNEKLVEEGVVEMF